MFNKNGVQSLAWVLCWEFYEDFVIPFASEIDIMTRLLVTCSDGNVSIDSIQKESQPSANIYWESSQWFSQLYKDVFRSPILCNHQTPPSPSTIIILFFASMSLVWFWFCFFKSAYKWNHIVFDFSIWIISPSSYYPQDPSMLWQMAISHPFYEYF